MEKNIELLKLKMDHINNEETEHDFGDNLVWFKTHRNGTTGIGKTFEDLIGKKEDNLPLPDFHGIELKAHDTNEDGYITLFTKSPNIPRGINSLIRDKYGYITDGKIKEFHTSVYSDKPTYNEKSNHYFRIINDVDNQSISLQAFDEKLNPINDTFKAAWSYNILKKTISNKIKTLAIVNTLTNIYNGKKYYSYQSLTIAKINLEILLNALNDGKLIVDFRIGAYHSGKNIGRTHDHGTGFRIKYNDLLKYTNHYDI